MTESMEVGWRDPAHFFIAASAAFLLTIVSPGAGS